MSETDKQSTSASSTDSTQKAEGQKSAETKTNFITADEFKAFETVLKVRLDGMSGRLGATADKLKPLVEALTAKQEDEKQLTLKSVSDRLDAERSKQAKREVKSALMSELEKMGVPAERREQAAKYIQTGREKQFDAKEDGDDLRAVFKDGDSELSIPDFMKVYAQTADWKFINPEPAAKTNKGTAGGQGGQQTGANHPGHKMTYKELRDSKNQDIISTFRKEFPDEYAAKQAEYFQGK